MDGLKPNSAPILIAEIGCNHKGDIEIAKEFIDVASDFCKIQHVKFQKRNNRELLSASQFDTPHPNPDNSYGSTYGEHREFLEFSVEQHRELQSHCHSRGLTYSSSVWDISSLREMISLKPDYIKIPSATNTHEALLSIACDEYPGEIHVSLGMTTRAEEEAIIALFQKKGRLKDLVLYACTSGYPIQADESCLLEIVRLRETYRNDVGAIGYSGHHNGISLDIVACTLGAEYIERHFTLDRTWKGTDHSASLEPDGLRRLQRNLEQTFSALSEKPQEILPIEVPQREKLKWRAE
ncbi:MAG: N-acetylneuraminate synthase [Alphaproteobacteria bacterium]|nr:N-acetylneuraminate synthase [Alphaproteobacteria bacterium]